MPGRFTFRWPGPRSLRWRLLGWSALTLAGIVAALGATLYYVQRRTIFEQVDASLRSLAEALARSMQPQEPGGRTFEIDLSDELVGAFEGAGGPHYGIWNAAGEIVDQSDANNVIARPAGPGVYMEDNRRMLALRGPAGALVVVGQRISSQRRRLHELMWMVLGLGGAGVVIALAGGWFLAGRALRPIRRMTRAAQAISAGNLSRRIDVARTEDELGALAGTLNDAFDRLERAFAQQARFAADASHELRTPLSIMISQAQLTLKRQREPAQYREALETTLAAAQRMRRIVDGLLKLARADAGQADLIRERVDLARVVRDAAGQLEPLAREQAVEIRLHTSESITRGDAALLGELVSNLVSNAIRYNRRGGTVDVRTAPAAEGSIELAVSDTGIGIPPADLPHVFERFYRVDRSRMREGAADEAGSGLGLAIAQWIVQAHDGRIALTSGEQEGTRVMVTLPPADGPGSTPA